MPKRILSSLILLPPVLLAVWFSFPYYEILLALCVAILAWEWDNMTSNRLTPCAIATTACAVCGLFMTGSSLSVYILIAVMLFLSFGIFTFSSKQQEPFPALKAIGIVYITLFAMAAAFVENKYGSSIIFWLLVMVWATDVGAMIIGCWLRGPRLCPSISPLKTWAGFFGGILFAVLFSVLTVWLFDLTAMKEAILAATVVSVVAQCGDLMESKIKRIVGVKDSSNLVPGHGGVFDRVDSLMLVMIFTALVAVIVGEVKL